MRIAIIGTGIAGMTSAWLLQRDHDLSVFEADDRIGGHTNTVEVVREGRAWPVDTGFIVCNDRTYPNFLGLMRRLGVALQPTDMSFSMRDEASGLEWAGANLDTLFCQRRNLFRFSFLRMVREVLRFNRDSLELLHEGGEIPLGEYLRDRGYHREFIDHYLVPMGGAIWSSSPGQMLAFPARFFVRFFHHHGMLTVNDRPQWMTVAGGSRSYRDRLIAPFAERIRRREPVQSLARVGSGAGRRVIVRTHAGDNSFDAVVVACHADQALRLINDASVAEQQVLSAFPYQDNLAILHTDQALMPLARKAWSAWNAHVSRDPGERVAVTYDLNILQRFNDAPCRFLVTLNHERMDPAQVIRRISYQHPLFTAASPTAQARHAEINGVDGLHFAGAYWRNGFHEDGVVSALQACAPLTGIRSLAEAA